MSKPRYVWSYLHQDPAPLREVLVYRLGAARRDAGDAVSAQDLADQYNAL